MSAESAFITALRTIASHPAARGLADDAAVLEIGDTRIVLTHDMLVEAVHYLPHDPPGDVAWKLVAVNLSDLAAKGAQPIGVLMGYGLTSDSDWDAAFVAGLGDALAAYGVPLLGGDTVALPPGNARVLGLTAIGEVRGTVPSRSGAKPGDALYVTGPIGDGWAGLQLLLTGQSAPASLIAAYRRPVPLLREGQALAPLVSAMMDVSDGLLIDARRMADASGLSLTIELADVPLSADFVAAFGDTLDSRLQAATGGDDYQLLFAAPGDVVLPEAAYQVGIFGEGLRLQLRYCDKSVPLPVHLGYQH